jgi:hypothetical protein
MPGPERGFADESRHRVSESPTAANLARLRARVVPGGVDRDSTALTFPRIEELFIEPGYRICAVSDGTRTGDENWWDARPVAWVPLRAVSAHAPVLDQIEEGLRLATNQRIAWTDLSLPGSTSLTSRRNRFFC